ncbi:MAG: hypothetical protein K1060chlam1_01474 [Candidatus Anoxychlamydiales bacterium]|nr:hypothetical protein [Candidatus Anoxychlamydiales bacterium]
MRNIKILRFFKYLYLLIFIGVLSISVLSVNKGYAAKNRSNSSVLNQGGSKSFQYNSIEEIDKKINELEEMKRGYEAKAIKQANQAQRLQFIEGELQAAKKNWRLAEDNRKIVVRLQKEIDELKIERMKLQKKRA